MYFLENGSVTSPKGFLASGVHCGLKKIKKDLALIYSNYLCNAAAVYTKNLVKGAPLTITKKHLKNGVARGIIINSGNANTCNGDRGLEDASLVATSQAKYLNVDPSDILVASTGIIGVPLNTDLIIDSIPKLTNSLSKNGSIDASSAILTTDTIKKECALSFKLKDKNVTIGCMSKGSGMIEPNMGTMLSFITTDVSISTNLLQEALIEATNISYNRVTVDGDTSTNDMVIILANGQACNDKISEKNDAYYTFLNNLKQVTLHQAKLIAKDGEGATKLILCTVKGAKTINDCEKLSKSVIKSNLVKTAIFGSDANWGRILCSLGYSGINFNPASVNLSFKSNKGEILVCQNGSSIDFNEEKAKTILLENTIEILVDIGDNDTSATCFGCDLTYDYIKINGDYRS